jgi:predicted MFS family arabinose efflux permease
MHNLILALVGVIITMILSVLVPCYLKNTQEPLLVKVRNVFQVNKQQIVVSSLIVGIIIYVSSSISPNVERMLNNSQIRNLAYLR